MDRLKEAREYIEGCRRWRMDHPLDDRRAKLRLTMYPKTTCNIYTEDKHG